MARNAAGRRQDTSDPLLLNLNWNAPFAGSGTNACGVQPPLVCVSNHYVLGNMYDRKTPYMVQYRLQRPARARTDHGARNRLPRLAQQPARADVRCQRGHAGARQPPGPAAVSGVHQDPGDRQRRRGQVQLAGAEADAAARSRALGCSSATRSRSPRTTAAASACSTATRCSRRTATASSANGACRSSTSGTGSCTSMLYELPFGPGKPFAQTACSGAILRRLADQRHREQVQRLPTRPGGRHDFPTPARRPTVRTSCRGQDPNDGPKTVQQWFNTAAFARPDAFTYGNAGRNIVIGPGIFTTDRRSSGTSISAAPESLQFRLEAFNLFNKPVWGDPQHVDGESAVRDDQHHAHADARAAARREVRVLSGTFHHVREARLPDARSLQFIKRRCASAQLPVISK